MNDRIRLAKLVGWKWEPCTSSLDHIKDWQGGQWSAPDGELMLDIVGREVAPPFDPKNDAHDCEALIRWLNSKGWPVIIEHLLDRSSVVIRNSEIVYNWCYDLDRDWKQGVCELALKVLDT